MPAMAKGIINAGMAIFNKSELNSLVKAGCKGTTRYAWHISNIHAMPGIKLGTSRFIKEFCIDQISASRGFNAHHFNYITYQNTDKQACIMVDIFGCGPQSFKVIPSLNIYMKTKRTLLLIILSAGSYCQLHAQDPRLPGVNLGLTSIQSGVMKDPGWSYLQYFQVYESEKVPVNGGDGKINYERNSSVSSLHQVIFRTNLKILNGQLGGTALLSLSTRTATGAQTVNPNPIGDALAGPFLEWQHHWRQTQLHYRVGVNFVFPTGAYSSHYTFNAGANRFRYFPHLEVTFMPTEQFTISLKNNLYIFSRESGSGTKSGTAYNLNYAFEYKVATRVTIAAVGYLLTQLEQDSFYGDKNYYRNQYGITDSKERVAGAGPGLLYKTAKGTSLELKAAWEFAEKNRTPGFRSTLVLAFPL